MQVVDRKVLSPEQAAAQGARRLLVGEDPTGVVLDQGSAAGKAFGTAVAVAPVPFDEGAQLGLTKGLLPLLVDYFFFPPRAP